MNETRVPEDPRKEDADAPRPPRLDHTAYEHDGPDGWPGCVRLALFSRYAPCDVCFLPPVCPLGDRRAASGACHYTTAGVPFWRDRHVCRYSICQCGRFIGRPTYWFEPGRERVEGGVTTTPSIHARPLRVNNSRAHRRCVLILKRLWYGLCGPYAMLLFKVDEEEV